jgi:uncharacterized alpha/beta hydrolase family protein
MRNMNKIKITLIVSSAIIIAACSSTKKSATSTSTSSSVPSATNSTNTSTSPFVFVKPADGINAPGNEELTAIQTQYKEVTLAQLKEGHEIYSEGACTRCHNAKNIYQMEISEWKSTLEDMAQKAYLSDVQKDAVYKYVLAMKATQPK